MGIQLCYSTLQLAFIYRTLDISYALGTMLPSTQLSGILCFWACSLAILLVLGERSGCITMVMLMP